MNFKYTRVYIEKTSLPKSALFNMKDTRLDNWKNARVHMKDAVILQREHDQYMLNGLPKQIKIPWPEDLQPNFLS